jgi:hypothetical protein
LGSVIGYVLCFGYKSIFFVKFYYCAIFFIQVFSGKSGSRAAALAFSFLPLYGLWSFDRFQQGHFFNYLFFLPVAVLFVDRLFYSRGADRKFILPLLLSAAFYLYYHYAFILCYLWALNFIIDLLKNENRKLVITEAIISGVCLVGLLAAVWMPYILVFSIFSGLQQAVSSEDVIRLFSWQSTSLSSFFSLRTGMFSYGAIGHVTWYLLPLASLVLFATFYGRREKTLTEKKVLLSVTFLLFLSLGFWLLPEFFLNFVYKLPTMSVFRDMNKFVGIALLLVVISLAGTYSSLRRYLRIVLVMSLLILSFVAFKPYKNYVTTDSAMASLVSDPSAGVTLSLPSYPISFIQKDNKTYHYYLPSLNGQNNVRFVSLPYYYQKDEASQARNSFFEGVYVGQRWMNDDQFANYLGNYGISDVFVYKGKDYRQASNEFPRWYNNFDVSKFSSLLNKSFSSEDLDIYKIPSTLTRPIVSVDTGSVKYRVASQSRIEIEIKSAERMELQMIANYSPLWSLYLVDGRLDQCQQSDWAGGEVYGCEDSSAGFSTSLLGVLGEPVFRAGHSASGENYNHWELDTARLNGARLNSDENVMLVAIFRPQGYFIIGLFVASATAIGINAYLALKKKRKRYEK